MPVTNDATMHWSNHIIRWNVTNSKSRAQAYYYDIRIEIKISRAGTAITTKNGFN